MFYTCVWRDRRGDTIACVVEAATAHAARFLMVKTYPDFKTASYVRIEESSFDDNGVCEVYYG